MEQQDTKPRQENTPRIIDTTRKLKKIKKIKKLIQWPAGADNLIKYNIIFLRRFKSNQFMNLRMEYLSIYLFHLKLCEHTLALTSLCSMTSSSHSFVL